MEFPGNLRPIAEQAFVSKQWPDFSAIGFGPCGSRHDMDSDTFNEFSYRHFHLPLLKVANKSKNGSYIVIIFALLE